MDLCVKSTSKNEDIPCNFVRTRVTHVSMTYKSTIYSPTDAILKEAAQRLLDGHLVVMPTETVYGLAANATDDRAVARIFALKERPSFNPLIVHVESFEKASNLIEMTDLAEKLAKAFWPGPLTLVGRRAPSSDFVISLLCSGGLDTLAVRVPAHPVARKLLSLAGVPLAAPSANPSTKLSPTSAMHVQQGFPEAEDLWILEGGECLQGLESTVVDVTGDIPVILRFGTITAENIEQAVGVKPLYYKDIQETQAIKSPGQMLKHYAPDKPMRLNVLDIKPGEGLLAFGSQNVPVASVTYNLSKTGDLLEAAQNLFKMLHLLDKENISGIAVMPIPQEGLGTAINDRLVRTQ